ncbi:hypothetical protein CEUSTIGMA_g8942.t1 [Chlamydomonas eustigma]|uniref:Glycerophosphocholine acyltransferase 1 n=1 Tax=Chlamydomonas eustigma TaxID=1157962 RepID=A0A250XEK4_9CHLO|nr:hypothetical protein CEUSTIGMA_g8942.t1 [Chlamydomonas eustigma]|eukprot:GAX81514.1 hypothetical protein CEUSTIGMA_g8942.t1 [Chlamydomonas eustigma]
MNGDCPEEGLKAANGNDISEDLRVVSDNIVDLQDTFEAILEFSGQFSEYVDVGCEDDNEETTTPAWAGDGVSRHGPAFSKTYLEDGTNLKRWGSNLQTDDEEGDTFYDALSSQKDVQNFGQQTAKTKMSAIKQTLDLRLRRIFHDSVWGPRQLLLKDKLSFLLGCTLMWICAYWLGHSPDTFFYLYTMLCVVLLPLRFFSYKRKKQHYYLLDFCCK